MSGYLEHGVWTQGWYDTRKTGGRHTIDWNGSDKNGRRVSSGFYFYRIEWAGQTLSRKMILLR